MYIRLDGDEHVLVRTAAGENGLPRETIVAQLGSDPELNLFLSAEQGRREHPELWDCVSDFHLLQALENFKRRLGQFKPALVALRTRAEKRHGGKASEPPE